MLDVGVGSGILFLFCVFVGVVMVYVVEASNIVDFCNEIVKCNKMEDKIKVIKGKIEDVEFFVEKVDIIVFEWMGFYLFYEFMFDFVLFVRDKWLLDFGMMILFYVILYFTFVNMLKYVIENFRFWENAYGYDFLSI